MEGSYDRYYILVFFLIYAFLNVQLLFSDKKDAERELQHVENIKRINASLNAIQFNKTNWGLSDPYRHYQDEVIDNDMILKAGSRFYNKPFGTARGDWKKGSSKSEMAVFNLTDSASDESWRKATNSSRKGAMKFELERTTMNTSTIDKNLVLVYGQLTLNSDIAQSETKNLLVEGLHVKSNGSIYLHGYSSAGLYDPANLLMILPQNLFSKAKEHFERNFNQSLNLFENMTDFSGNKTCWIQMVVQLAPFDQAYSLQDILDLEEELEKPQGLATIPAMPLQSSMFIYSPNCPEVALSAKVKGRKAEVIISKEISYAAMTAGVGLIEALLVIAQTEYSTTHSMASKVSIWSLLIHMVLDGYMLLIHIYSTIFLPGARLPLLSSAFFFLITLAWYQINYLRTLLRVQHPESSHLRNGRNLGLLNLFFYFLMLGGLVLLFQTITSRGSFKQLLLQIFFFGLYSFWIPQIWRNLARGTSKGLSTTYVVGVSITKLVVPLYFFACPENLLGISTDTNSWIMYLIAHVAAQIFILFSQDWLGPRWFVPSFLLPPTYNYHPVSTIAPANEEEPLDPNQSDCAICMVSLMTSDNSGSSGSSDPSEPLLHTHNSYKSAAALSLSRFTNTRGIMVTPCQHYFHTLCLEQWMKIKLECPVCRTSLPPN